MLLPLLAGTVLAMAATPAAAASPYLWKERVVLIRAANPGDAALNRQRDLLLADEAGLRERDLAVFAVIDDGSVVPVFGRAPTPAQASALPALDRKRGGFAVALIGKDGGVKDEASEPMTARRIFGQIDGMPMRRQEMRERR